mmetsp:Transcript_37645/g.93598  ORF Transcript_37645/g.93598 Transcript_37645/m.93598 type:complete len:207 (+) Transcript_37645:279-899(+)
MATLQGDEEAGRSKLYTTEVNAPPPRPQRMRARWSTCTPQLRRSESVGMHGALARGRSVVVLESGDIRLDRQQNGSLRRHVRLDRRRRTHERGGVAVENLRELALVNHDAAGGRFDEVIASASKRRKAVLRDGSKALDVHHDLDIVLRLEPVKFLMLKERGRHEAHVDLRTRLLHVVELVEQALEGVDHRQLGWELGEGLRVVWHE